MELSSLIGQLQHASCVVKPEKVLLEADDWVGQHGQRFTSPHQTKKKLQVKPAVVGMFLPDWNGFRMMSGNDLVSLLRHNTTDLSEVWGCVKVTQVG